MGVGEDNSAEDEGEGSNTAAAEDKCDIAACE